LMISRDADSFCGLGAVPITLAAGVRPDLRRCH
jgi:hypothetical protein